MEQHEMLRIFLMRSARGPIRGIEGGNPRLKGGEMALTGTKQVITLEVKRIP
jgi:hypothetical protein